MLKASPETHENGNVAAKTESCRRSAQHFREEAMKRITLVVRSTLLIGVFGTALAAGSASLSAGSLAAGASRCSDRCADRYKLRKDTCRAIPLKSARRICQDAAKQAKKECKRNCR